MIILLLKYLIPKWWNISMLYIITIVLCLYCNSGKAKPCVWPSRISCLMGDSIIRGDNCSLRGQISSSIGPCEKVKVFCFNVEGEEQSMTYTGTSGTFLLNELNCEENYELRFALEKNEGNKILLSDVAALNTIFSNQVKIADPLVFAKADINSDGEINSNDLQLLKKAFFKEDILSRPGPIFQIANEDTHLKAKKSPNLVQINVVYPGDFGNGVKMLGTNLRSKINEWTLENYIFEAKDVFTQEFISRGDLKCGAIQLGFYYNPKIVELCKIEEHVLNGNWHRLNPENYFIKDGYCKLLLLGDKSLEMSNQEPCLRIFWNAKQNGCLSSALQVSTDFDNQILNEDGHLMDFILRFDKAYAVKNEISDFQISPKSFNFQVQIRFESSFNGLVRFEVANLSGKKQIEEERYVKKGLNIWQLGRDEFCAPGEYLCSIKYEKHHKESNFFVLD